LISLSIVGWPFIFMTEFILNGSYRAEVEFRVNDVKDLLEEKAFTAGFNAGVHSALTDEDEENAGPVVMIPREKQEEFMAMVEQLTGQKIERPPEKPLTPSEDDVE
jgi:hypothetical protein